MDCGEHASPGWGSRLWHHHIVTKIASDRSPKTKKYFPSPLLCVLLSMWKWQRGSCSLYLSSKYLHTEKTVKSTPWGHQNLCVRQPLLWHKQLINKNCTASSSASCVAYLRARVCVSLCVFYLVASILDRSSGVADPCGTISCSSQASCATQETRGGLETDRNRRWSSHLSACAASVGISDFNGRLDFHLF